MSFTREHNERLPRQNDSCGQELDLYNRSFSLPDCSKSATHIWDQQSASCNRSLSVSTPSKSTRWALYRSFSYEQGYIKEGSDFRKSPVISICKLEHSFVEYYSPGNWKKESVVKASKFNQDSSFLPGNRLSNDNEIKDSGLSKSTYFIPIDSVKWHGSLKKWMATDRFKFLFFLVIPLIVLSVGIVTFCALASRQQFCKDSLNLQIIKSDFSQNIYGQDLAVQSFLGAIRDISSKNLNEKPNDSLMSVVVFLGGTGVGKSYMASLFTNLYPTHWTVQKFNALIDLIDKESTDRVLVEVMKKLSHCGTNLIIVDDASNFMLSSSTTKGFHFVKKLHYAIQIERKKSILILILNNSKEKSLNNTSLCTQQSINSFKQSLENLSNIQTYLIEFLPLSNEHIVKCIKKAMEREETGVPDHEIFKSLDMHEVKYFPNGCKGIYKYIHQISSKESSKRRIIS